MRGQPWCELVCSPQADGRECPWGCRSDSRRSSRCNFLIPDGGELRRASREPRGALDSPAELGRALESPGEPRREKSR
eukprot:11984477-Alexandrium_andersonii.AAC.1